jgi:(1->4)-alpha-D-glucan 1-alpha-D-glucosylmutase
VRPPTSTYRLQLHAGFPLPEALRVADYLDELGVGAVYVSPVLRAQRGSTHGYDLVDPACIDPALGGKEAFDAWADALARRGMRRIVDFVPNHMGVGSGENPWWNDVLEDGPSSPYADFFDIDWRPPKAALADKVLLPVLGAQYGEALERGELRVGRAGGGFFVAYFEHRWPLSPATVRALLRDAAAPLGAGRPCAEELVSLGAALARLPDGRNAPRGARDRRARERARIKSRVAALFESAPEAAAAVEDAMHHVNVSVDALDGVLREQSYRLADWRVATEEINYRRFFDNNQLAAIRMEDPEVFAAMHALVLRLVAEGRIDGVRLDHTDGLYDPAAYFESLERAATAVRDATDEGGLYLVAEKILEPGEALPRAWAIAGTTGYDFLADVNGLWVDPAGEAAMTRLCAEMTGDTASFEEVAGDSKRAILRSSLASEVNMLAQSLERLADARRRSRDFTLRSLTTALFETLVAFPVYRTYLRPGGTPEPADEGHVKTAIARAKRRSPEQSATVFDFLEDMLLLRSRDLLGEDARAAQVAFSMRFQQMSGPVMAKGVEDTAFYRYTRLLSLNEVGGSPSVFGTSVARFHAGNADRCARGGSSMVATSTHDTKRGEDARARLAVLSEIPDRWRSQVAAWEEIARSSGRPEGAPDASPADDPAVTAADRYYFYQAVVASLPPGSTPTDPEFVRRACEHMAKATKEEKRETRWTLPDEAYDRAVQRFTKGMLEDARFAGSLAAFVASIAHAGATNALAQAVLKLTSPGVADTYQGTELWCFDFCDPDNRRPVDYGLRRAHLSSLRGAADRRSLAAGLLDGFEDGRIKMLVTHRLLRLRRDAPGLVVGGSYEALWASGDAKPHVVAFAREGGGRRLVTATARRSLALVHGADRWGLGDAWGDGQLPLAAGDYLDVLTDQVLTSTGSLPLRDLFAVLPVAVLLT